MGDPVAEAVEVGRDFWVKKYPQVVPPLSPNVTHLEGKRCSNLNAKNCAHKFLNLREVEKYLRLIVCLS